MTNLQDLQAELNIVKESIKHHRIATFSIVTFLILLTIVVNVVFQSTTPSSQSTTTEAKSPRKQEITIKKQGVTVELNTQYENPFDKNSQYVNPFSEYKNPFDTLK